MFQIDLKRARFFFQMWRAKGRLAAVTLMRDLGHNHLHVISRDPAVVYLWWGRDDTLLHKGLSGLPMTLLYLFPWCGSVENIGKICSSVTQRLKEFPEHRIVFLCNELSMVEPLRNGGVEAVFCNQNAFLNEDVFRPLPNIPKEFDAIYNASMAPYKRHALAANVPSLAMLSYSYPGAHTDSYASEIKQTLAHAVWLKDSSNDAEKVSVEQMVEFYNRSHVGLILSECEGAVFASMEYLLCGLPVVSTPSVGGRDVFWDERFVIVCEPKPEAVAEAVQELKSRNISPELIRSATLERVFEHRKVLKDFLAPEVETFDCPWPPGSHGPFTYFDLKRLGKALANGEPIPLP